MSNEIRSILAAVDRGSGETTGVPAKALALARLVGAQLEFFLCDPEVAFNLEHQYEPEVAARAREQCLRELRDYLETLRRSLAVRDVETSLSVACESPGYESIVHAVKRSRPDLVVRGTAPGAPLDPNDWELVAECPVPLLLTRGRPWKPRPTIAAAIDISSGESQELTRAILRISANLANAAGGAVEVVHAGRFDAGTSSALDACRTLLAQQVRDAGLDGAGCHVVAGDPVEALMQFAERRNVDLFVLGALTHRKTLGALVGTLTGRLIESLDSDFLLVRPVRTPP